MKDATIDTRFSARKVYLVLGSHGRAAAVEVRVDGSSRARHRAAGRASSRARLSLPRAGEHRLNLRVEPGVAGYAFTFG